MLRLAPALAALFALFTLAPAAAAQLAAYATFTNTNFNFKPGACAASDEQCVEPAPNNFLSAGTGFGVSFNLPSQSPLKAGIDLRGSYNRKVPGGTTVLVAGKFSVAPRGNRLHPYVDLGAGHVSATTDSILPCSCAMGPNATGPPDYSAGNTFFAIAIGLDVRLRRGLELRALEVGFSPAPRTPSGAGAVVSAPTTIGTGLVVVLPFPRGRSRP
jgi:hypothetical protein